MTMTAEQLEELAGGANPVFMGLDYDEVITGLARRVLAAEKLVEALRAELAFAEGVADAADIDPDDTVFCVKVMPGGKEIAERSWSAVHASTREALAAWEAAQ